jgi:polar amino acid transport system ATP-binding protein
MHDQTPAVEIKSLRKSFGDLEVLKGVDLTVQSGQIFSILGSSGSGKSTLLRCVNWLEEPNSGTILIEGEAIGRQTDGKTKMGERDLARMRAKTAMVFQSFNLWPHLTVLQNVIEAPVHVQGVPKDKAIADAESLLDRVGMSAKMDVYPWTLSGGQKQRVAIARGLAMRPKVILFDEPTSALDPELVGEVQDVIRSLAEEHFTMIIVTHEMDFARSISDEVVFLHQGTIIEQGTPEEFFGNPKTERLQQFLERYSSN